MPGQAEKRLNVAVPVSGSACLALSLFLVMFSMFSAREARGSDEGVPPASDSTVVYDRAYFSRYELTTAMDMLLRVPGVDSIVQQATRPPGPGQQRQERGFGSGGDQILINNKRIAGKANEIASALERIQADQVLRVELIRGTSADVDVRSEGVVVNIIVDTAAAGGGTGSWQVSGLFSDSGNSYAGGNLSYGGSRENLQYLMSIAASPELEFLRRNEWFYLPDGRLEERRFETETRPQNEPVTVTGNLILQVGDSSELRLNGLVSVADRLNRETTDRTPAGGPGQPETLPGELRSDVTDVLNWEVGLDYETPVGPGTLQALAIHSYKEENAIEDLLSITPGDRVTEDLEIEDAIAKESIIRSAFSWDLAAGQNLEIGLELAQNSLDTDLQIFQNLAGELQPLDLFNPDSLVEETRYEVFITDKWQTGPRSSLELGLNAESSRLSQRGSEFSSSRSFSFIKPRVDYRYDLNPASQLRFRIERTVTQLDFGDFVASFDFQDDEVDFGNPNLAPENAWEFEAQYEHRLADDNGVITARAFLHDISDHIDKGTIDVDRDGFPDLDELGLIKSARANIGDAQRYGIELKTSFRLSFLGLPDAMVNASVLTRHAETTDPFTNKKRNMYRTPRSEWSLGFRHDLSARGVSYGTGFSSRLGVFRTDDVRDRWRWQGGVDMNVFLEARVFGDLLLRIEGERLLQNKAKRSRRLYETTVAAGDLELTEYFHRWSDRFYTVSLRGSF